MKKYEEPAIEIVVFIAEDILTTSAEYNTREDELTIIEIPSVNG